MAAMIMPYVYARIVKKDVEHSRLDCSRKYADVIYAYMNKAATI